MCRLLHNILPARREKIGAGGDRLPLWRFPHRLSPFSLRLFPIGAALNATAGRTQRPLRAITVMRAGRCAQIIHQQQQRVESNLFDVAVLSIFVMTDSEKDEPQGSVGGGVCVGAG